MRWAVAASGLMLAAVLLGAAERAPNTLTDEEKAAGWELLFDGQTAAEWRNFRRDELTGRGWTVENGCLKLRANGQGGGDICSRQKYANFELSLEVWMTPGANSGVMYHVTDEVDPCWQSGPEVAIQEEPADRRNKHSFGALYDMVAPNENKLLKPPGEWNELRIKLDGDRGEHWLNGQRIVEYQRFGAEWDALVAGSKFKDMPRFGKEREGFICLQDHGNELWFRNIKVRRLP